VNSEGKLLLEAAQELARRAASVAMRYFRTPIKVESKRDGSPVTEADKAAEQAARDWVMSRFPDDGILGEEFEVHRPEARRRWIIDPIDGTKSFVRRVPLWGTLVAVCEGEDVLAGAACFPAVDETIAAASGLGCWWNGSRAHVSGVSDLGASTVLTTDERFKGHAAQGEGWQRLTERASIARTWGDCYGYLLVATGRAEVMVDAVMSPWDSAALLPIITESGGVFSDWNGHTTAFGSNAIATNAALAKPVREILGVPVAVGA
jgi:histidinol phosphatase-like enzyme (inositol monophosphatase family)